MSLNARIADWAGRRVWLVGASSGIGAALAGQLAERGARLALSARSAARLEACAGQCMDAGAAEARAAPMDATHADDFARVRDALLADWGGIDLVVLNAGTYRPLRAWELTPQAVRETLDVNLLAVMDGVAAVVPMLLAQAARGEPAALIIVGSVAGYAGLPRAAAYGPSKAALINLTESLYLDLAPRGVSVFLVSPGFVATPLTAQNDFHMPALQTPQQAASAILRGLAAGRFEIHFPRRFSLAMKLLRLLPYPLYFRLVRRGTGL
ncbi:MAG TPA: SDR family NAD(P)-dependent oxidoreductase [Rhodocyclaceae bacterium]|nr:SDR family NAD(P)-dependent oxidoreductase [Rhodocyclaceae bacterium]